MCIYKNESILYILTCNLISSIVSKHSYTNFADPTVFYCMCGP